MFNTFKEDLVVEAQRISYAVTIPDTEIFLKLDDSSLDDDLINAGAYDVDWNGHFGSTVFFTIDYDENRNQTLQRCLGIIQSCIENIRT